ncbi:hypothetical protein SAMN04490203_2824 [Pseudomonas taetrolens]|uniref:Fe-S protein n=1 Tax=Pseudomonas taetrolens TaxID=47884 RepID=A0A1H4U8I1_PSETA|nr:DUF1289 domain-containing protein [Pseudomonas taetrolens]SEC64890.1 hypothetical protein SAMN04490203_2824 [Pseudomonas taetrolens]
MSKHTVTTPCIGLCSTVFGDLICRGCKRFHHEIIQWNGYTDHEKVAILLRLETLLTQVMTDKIIILDAALLREQLDARKIRYYPHQSAYCWAYQLIAKGAENIININAYGVDVRLGTRDVSLVELRKQIDREFFILSETHYHHHAASFFLNDTHDHAQGLGEKPDRLTAAE